MASSNPLTAIFQCIDQNENKLLQRLREAIAILPDSSSEKSLDSTGLFDWINNQLKSFGFSTNLKNVDDESYDAREPPPPVIFASLETGHCPNKPTILVYSHLDGRDAQREDGWNIELTGSRQTEENVYVQGVLNMSSLIGWLNTIETFRTIEIDIPVNVKLIVVFKELESSVGFKNLLISEKDNFLGKVEYICINEGSWLQSDTPTFVKKLRGLCYFSIEVKCSDNNLDSNKCNGIVQEAIDDLLYLLGCLKNEQGNLNFSGMNLQEEELCEEETVFYETTDLDLDKFMESVGANSVAYNGNKTEIIKHRMITSNLTIHSIQSSLEDVNEWTIPSFAFARLSLRSFHINISEIFECINTFLQERWKLRGSSNELKVSLEKTYHTWFADLDHVHYEIARKAARHVYQKPTRFLNSGFTIPVVNMLQEVIGKNILLLPISSENSYMNETIPIRNYLDASKMFANYLYEMGEVPRVSSESSASFVSCESVPELCVCGRVEEEIKAGSGDAEAGPPTKPRTNLEEDERSCACPYRIQIQTKDKAVIADDLMEESDPPSPPKPCKCILQYQPVDVEVISLKSTPSKDLPKAPQGEETRKKDLTASVDTIRCVCIPERYRTFKRKVENVLHPEKEDDLAKSMRSIGSKISGISACEYPSGLLQTHKMKILGCVCPEKSQETVCDGEMQKERMYCPVRKGRDEICNKGGKRRHHLAGPPPVEEDESEISLGPLSHCSCPSEESIIVPPNCDCSKDDASPMQKGLNMDDEID